MNCNVTLTAEEFKNIHNALWYLGQIDKPEVEKQVEVIRTALQGAYQQEHDVTDRRYDHYRSVKQELGLSAIWSMTEVDNLSERHPFEGVNTVTYKDHWGDSPVVTQINGGTWAALYVAANAAIRDSGDEHHVFIEDFRKVGDTLILTTGS
jgi:hypothetical protein